ncbi:MAG: HAD family hydrolase [Promethearchaeota archaeon]|nr:MAG: HAD family hydrolase [Candidatus Lokiarchaeota archaeon]
MNIPNYGKITIKNVIFDVNGTIQFKGQISEEVREKFEELKKNYEIYLISADTRGNLKKLAEKLDVFHIRINPEDINEAEAKNIELIKLGKDVTVAIGNGNNDVLMIKNAVLGISVLGSEGATVNCLLNSDVVVPDTLTAIEFLLDEKIMIGTLRS